MVMTEISSVMWVIKVIRISYNILKTFILGVLIILFQYGRSNGDKLNSISKAILYFEKGEKEKAYNLIKEYEGEAKDSPIISIILAQKEKNESILEKEFEALPPIDGKFKDRIAFEKAKILFEKGQLEKSKSILEELKNKSETVKPSISFILANIYLLEGQKEKAKSEIYNIPEDDEDIDKIKVKKLKNLINEQSAEIHFKGGIDLNSSFSTKGYPIVFEGQDIQKRWDIVSNILGNARFEFLKSKEYNPFFEINGGGEFYSLTENLELNARTPMFFYQNSSAGLEIEKFGAKYSFITAINDLEVFSLSHRLSPYFYLTNFLAIGANFELETKNKIEGRQGIITFLDSVARYTQKFGIYTFSIFGYINLGKRFAKDERFSETFISPYTEISFQVKEIGISLSGFSSIMLFPQDFSGRKNNIIWFISPALYLQKDFILWEIAKTYFEGNFSNSPDFSWDRIRIGTNFKIYM
jgi:tetratricopeptide (TPR) repeat protein